ncbi:MAG TPA: beta-galactosidase [Planctomycetota bacterium]|nr:beta-galactosidase [Planctomycetota bacterium]
MDFIRNNLFRVGGLDLFPNSAEMHYWRVERKFWPFCFKEIKDAAFKIVSTCVPWNLHEYEPEKFDFTGATEPRRDLLTFLKECRQMGFRIILKPGPYIGAEWPAGGLPDYLFAEGSLAARNAEDEPLAAGNAANVQKGFAPCYAHPDFLKHVKRYYSALVDAIREQLHPNGNVFLIQLDNEPSHCLNSKPFDADYHEIVTLNLYPQFLKAKYKEIERLNSIYLTDLKDFNECAPPRKLEVKTDRDLTKFFDWVDFKERYLATYLVQLRKMLTDLGVDTGFCTSIRWGGDFAAPANWPMFDKFSGLAAINLHAPHAYYQTQRYIRYLAGTSKMAWASEMMAGKFSNDPDNAREFTPVPEREQRFLLLASLAAGLRGANFRMFVERDHWYDSPVTADGRRGKNWDFYKKLNEVAADHDFFELDKISNLGVVHYQPYTRYAYLNPEKPFEHVKELMHDTLPGLCTDLGQLGVDYTIVDPAVPESLDKCGVLFIPVAAFLDDAVAKYYEQLALKGKHLVFYGVTPTLDLLMRKSQVFSNAFGIRSTYHFIVEQMEWNGMRFPAYSLGKLKYEEGLWQPLLKDDRGNVYSAKRKMGEGTVHFLGYEPASHLVPHKKLCLEAILNDAGAQRPVRVSEPLIEAFIKKSTRHTLMFLINPNETVREAGGEPTVRTATLSLDLKLLGMHPDSVTFVNLFTGVTRNEPLSTVRAGMQFDIENYDVQVFEVIPDYGK